MIRVLLLLPIAALAALSGCERDAAPELTRLPPRSDPAVVAQRPATDPAPVPSTRLVPPPEALTDPVITAKVKMSLHTDPALRGADVSVNTDRGVVNLTGLVASQEQAAVASSHAQRQDGVMRVENHLAVDLH